MTTTATKTKERGIVLSAFEVRALAEGRLTQLRRVVKPQPMKSERGEGRWLWSKGAGRASYWMNEQRCDVHEKATDKLISSESQIIPVAEWLANHHERPYRAGDVLFVKEKWGVWSVDRTDAYAVDENDAAKCEMLHGRWWPATWMTRDRSRFSLRIVDVRVERVQDVTEEDAMASGCEGEILNEEPFVRATPQQQYLHQWDLDNGGKYPSIGNPWVWRLTVAKV